MFIYLLSTTYPSKFSVKGSTPVVKYFVNEWAKTGNRIHVFHNTICYPKIYYFFGRIFKSFLDTKLGHLIPIYAPYEYEEEIDGVQVSHIILKKYKPHGRFSHSQINRAFKIISRRIEKEGVPDCFIGHWDNPQLELLSLLKQRFNRPICLVYHSNQFKYLYSIYKKDTDELVKSVDLVGFRNITAQDEYEKLFGKPKNSFIAASGVSKPFIEAGQNFERQIKEVKNFAFVGSLIKRKYPITVLESLAVSFGEKPFNLTYIGEGNEKVNIQNLFKEKKCKGSLVFTGRIPRDEVIDYLRNTDVFVMISKGEIFGLVYLEAMALGCITIAARHEGIDGIIEDGENGFLCEAGNSKELAAIITRIRNMSSKELNGISRKAIEIANHYTDVKVAECYLNNIKRILE